MSLKVAIVVVFLASVLSIVGCNTIVNLDSGPIDGTIETVTGTNNTQLKLIKYLGIKYAEANRFELPQPPTPWKKTIKATSRGPACFQKNWNRIQSEDCLYLNVFVPHKSLSAMSKCKQKKYAVIVWLYSQGFFNGDKDVYDGDRLAAEGDVIVVSINYRLGIFGFLSGFGGILDGIQGNYGLYDQIEALKWVQRNIAKFGGDPTRVTLMGSSAGSISATLLSLSPMADNLFYNVILMSGFGNSIWVYRDKHQLIQFLERSSFRRMQLKFSKYNIPCKGPNGTLDETCLKTKILPCDLLKFQEILAEDLEFFFLPIVGEKLIKDEPKDILRNGTYKKRNVLLGVNNYDGSNLEIYLPSIGIYEKESNPLKNIRSYLKRFMDLKGMLDKDLVDLETPTRELTKLYYKAHKGEPSESVFYKMMTEVIFRYPAQSLANAFSKKSATFLYQLECRPFKDQSQRDQSHGQDLQSKQSPAIVKEINDERLGQCQNDQNEKKKKKNARRNKKKKTGNEMKSRYAAHHGDLAPFLFGRNLEADSARTPEKYFNKVSKRIIKMWTSFAKTGSPTKDKSKWPEYKESKPNYLVIKPKQPSMVNKALIDPKYSDLVSKLNKEY